MFRITNGGPAPYWSRRHTLGTRQPQPGVYEGLSQRCLMSEQGHRHALVLQKEPEEGAARRVGSMEHCRSHSPLASWREKHPLDRQRNMAGRLEYRVLDGMCFTVRRGEPADEPNQADPVSLPTDSRCLRAILEGIGENAVTIRAGARIALEFRGHSVSERTVAVALDAITTVSKPVVAQTSLSRSISLPKWSTERATPSLGVRPGSSSTVILECGWR
jgi:hypothetical protein